MMHYFNNSYPTLYIRTYLYAYKTKYSPNYPLLTPLSEHLIPKKIKATIELRLPIITNCNH